MPNRKPHRNSWIKKGIMVAALIGLLFALDVFWLTGLNYGYVWVDLFCLLAIWSFVIFEIRKRQNRKADIIIGCLLVIVLTMFFATDLLALRVRGEDAQQILNTYLAAASRHDFNEAYRLRNSDYQKENSSDYLAAYITKHPVFYEGYSRINEVSFKVPYTGLCGSPRGTISCPDRCYLLNGNISYDDGSKARFSAKLTGNNRNSLRIFAVRYLPEPVRAEKYPNQSEQYYELRC